MFKKINFLLFVILTILSSMTLEAVEIKDLYQASVAINSQSSGDRAHALKKALAAVMLKVGGEQSVLDNEIIKQSLNNFDSYLNQYRYQEKSIKVEGQLSSKKQLFILASFNEEKINQLFQQANLPLWGSLRPQVLLWLIEEQGLQRRIISSSSASTLPYKVNEFSAQRGLPIIMPLMDLTDLSQLTISDVWGRFQQPIKEASNRYLAEAIVVMRISNSSLITDSYTDQYTDTATIETNDCDLSCVESKVKKHNYVLDWSLLDWGLVEGQQKLSRQYVGDEPQELLQHGLADITELIYQRYALSTTKQNDYIIEVANIDSLATYVDVFNFLNNLSGVKSATLLSAKGSARRFNLQLLGSSDALLASLKLDNTLVQIIDPLAQFNTPSPAEGEGILVPIFNWSK
ncbi:DUF2066 domain-containing protein [Colwellia sp. 4_MG-2023]|jgi:hypothetical protein|uniref:DUF2066 domain-containing protein n=1 Tax=unclassified Colwellia TaxID=196834 RepID=UPI001C0A217E|nr:MULTISPECIES: DUF2066 domain-containing protein [unclassified Colwellia]MBU2924763.1 DUF2066 domain-containing protein [Colwellia sp. C2M11]MDO6489549.1 DUF2066 domain-containing protein [Colwellia sp. 6_MG-2023]MDO6508632.1 DUF2066 domain-containing protein [Colwellia sp. 5_MG-2023]MDO6557261.1 DUF2066 domain-containing protein [Colwellia sp. 4_MG-2023]MDO6653836.1 DUF2066 domain-containing protein [Colwellia sp. 3_MG-2023]